MGKRPLPPPAQQQHQHRQQQHGSNEEQLMKTKKKNKLEHGQPTSAVAEGNGNGRSDNKPSSSQHAAASNKGQATTGREAGPTTTSKAAKVCYSVAALFCI